MLSPPKHFDQLTIFEWRGDTQPIICQIHKNTEQQITQIDPDLKKHVQPVKEEIFKLNRQKFSKKPLALQKKVVRQESLNMLSPSKHYCEFQDLQTRGGNVIEMIQLPLSDNRLLSRKI
jgi:hypothetical protein